MRAGTKHSTTLASSREGGSVMFFVAGIVFPLLVVMFSLSLEFVSFFRKYETIQELVDNAAIQGTQSLPYSTQAADLVRRYVESRLGPQGAALSVMVDSSADSISVDLDQNFKLSLASYLGINTIPFRVSSRARRNPLDIVLGIDFGSYTAPQLGVPSWSDPANPQAWAPSASMSLINVPLGYAAQDVQNFVTQRCFNPALLPIKLAAINLFDTLSSIRLNSVGLAFFPDPSSGPYIARSVAPAQITNSAGALQSEAQADLSAYSVATIPVGDANCGAIEDEARSSTGAHPYKLPGLSNLINSPSSYSTVDQISIFNSGLYQFNPQYLNHLSAREAIWFRAARDLTPITSTVLNRLYNETLLAPTLATRAGLMNSAEKVVIILAGDTPWHQGDPFPFNNPNNTQALTQALDLFDGASGTTTKAHLYYLVFPHIGNNSAASLDTRVSQLRTLFSQYSNAHLIYADSAKTLSEQLVGQLNLLNARGVLSK
jgi:Flp pilus assembly protein TadG